jgi:hypothetical protein
MERQQQMAASEQYRQHLINQIAIDSGMSASSLRTEADSQLRQSRLDRMLKPSSESSDFQETEDNTVFSRGYDDNIERQQNIELALKQEAEFNTKKKRDAMKKLVSDDLDKGDLALYNAQELAKQSIRDRLQRATELQMEQLKQHRYDTQRDTDIEAEKERAIMKQQLLVELEEEKLKAYQHYNNLIVTAENEIETRMKQLEIQKQMMAEDREVVAQTRREMEAKKASSSTAQVLTIGQGGTPTVRKAEAERTKFGTHKNETKDLEFWYKMPLGFLADQAQAHGWRLQGEYYIQRSGAKVKQKNMTKLDWRREIFLILNIDDPLDP